MEILKKYLSCELFVGLKKNHFLEHFYNFFRNIHNMSEVVKNYRNIIGEIRKFHKEFSATSKDPKLIAISKTFPEVIKKVIEDGHKIFGENKVQEALNKWTSLKKFTET